MPAATPENPLLRRRNSVILPAKLRTTATSSLSSASSSSLTNSVSDDFMSAAPENPLRRGRRNSVILPAKLTLHHQSSASTITTTTGTAIATSSASSLLTNSVSDDFISAAPENHLLRRGRRNSVILPAKLNLHHQSASASTITTTATTTATSSSSASSSLTNSVSDDYELFSIKPISYTSLRDLLPPAAVNSPRPISTASNNGQSGSEISIRNRLVKQAAWAYLQPMSTSPDSSGRSLFTRLFFRFPVNNPVAGVINFVDRIILAPLTRAVDWLLRAIRIRSSR